MEFVDEQFKPPNNLVKKITSKLDFFRQKNARLLGGGGECRLDISRKMWAKKRKVQLKKNENSDYENEIQHSKPPETLKCAFYNNSFSKDIWQLRVISCGKAKPNCESSQHRNTPLSPPIKRMNSSTLSTACWAVWQSRCTKSPATSAS